MTDQDQNSRLAKWDPPLSNLRGAARKGVKQTTSFRIVSLAIQFASAAVLARILGPEALGTVALATLVTAFATLFNDMGIGSAIVQRKRLDEEMLSTAFWLNLAIGFALFAIITAASPFLSMYFNSPDLRFILPLSSLSLVLSVSLVQRALLQRKMSFGAVMGLDFLYGLVSSVISIACALLGFGVVSVPIGAVISTAICSIAAAVLCPWRPRVRPTVNAFRGLWNYSGGLLAFDVLNYWGNNIDNLLVGKFLGVAPLGFYSRAYNLMQLPVSNLTRVLTTVLFPALSTMQDDRQRFARSWMMSSKLAMLLGIWVAATTAVSSPFLISTLYGEKWLPASTALTLLMAATPAYILASNASPIFLALGHTGLQFRLGLVTVALRVSSIVIGLQAGYEGVAIGILVSSYLNILITVLPAMRLAQIPVINAVFQLRWIALGAMSALLTGIALRLYFHAGTLVMFLVISMSMSAVFAVVTAAFDRQLIREVVGSK